MDAPLTYRKHPQKEDSMLKFIGSIVTGAVIATVSLWVGAAYGQQATQTVQTQTPATIVVVQQPATPAPAAQAPAAQAPAAQAPAATPAAAPAPEDPAPSKLSDMVSWYQDQDRVKGSNQSPFGGWAAEAYKKANAETVPEVRAVKVEKADRLSDAFTKAVLDQDQLHIQSYTALVRLAAKDPILAETVERERLADEKEVEELANPSFWTTVKWWWNR